MIVLQYYDVHTGEATAYGRDVARLDDKGRLSYTGNAEEMSENVRDHMAMIADIDRDNISDSELAAELLIWGNGYLAVRQIS
jgi:hypothetical protein